MSFAFTSIASFLTTAGSLAAGPVTMLSLIPLLAIGMNYYRYQSVDPEGRPIEATKVSTNPYVCNTFKRKSHVFLSLFQIRRHYDFIVVGAGSAGAVMASRLSENKNWTVLLIEAGGDETEISDVPALAGYLQLTDLDWQYQTAPPDNRAYCQAMIGDRCNWPRGKVMGGKRSFKEFIGKNLILKFLNSGSSVLNAMVSVH